MGSSRLTELAADTLIKNSEWILRLPDDWDDQGTKAPSQETFDRAAAFVRAFIGGGGWDTPRPTLTPGPNDGLDFYIRCKTLHLLAWIPPNPKQPISLYAENPETGKSVHRQLGDDEATTLLAGLTVQLGTT